MTQPPELTNKQKSFLRGLGQKLQAVATIGKAGITDAVVQNMCVLLDQHELVKVSLPAGSSDDRRAAGEQLASACGAACAGVVGRTALLFRASETLPPQKRIHMPSE